MDMSMSICVMIYICKVDVFYTKNDYFNGITYVFLTNELKLTKIKAKDHFCSFGKHIIKTTLTLCGLSCVWMILWRHNVEACQKPFPQVLHTNGRAPV